MSTAGTNATIMEKVVRAHDITVCLERKSVGEFENLQLVGLATRLALHLRGVPAVTYELVKNVAIYLLDFPVQAVKPVLNLLAEAEFVTLVTQGVTIQTVIPDIPYYERLFVGIGEVSDPNGFSEHETFALDLQTRLAASPLVQETVYNMGADRTLVDRIVDVGCQSAFLSKKRARGRDVIISPTYFSESPNAYADLVAGHGAGRVKRVLELLQKHQGWPLAVIISIKEIGGVKLTDEDVAVLRLLAADGFASPPAIRTTHAGTNYFLFGPRPDQTRLPSFKRSIYEAAMALVAAVRQGQLLPAKYRIRSPFHIIRKLKNTGYIGATSEALDQYRAVAALRVGRLVHKTGDRYQFELIRSAENIEAVDLALAMVTGQEAAVGPDQDIVLALRHGEEHVDSLIGRKRLLEEAVAPLDEDSQAAIDQFLLTGAR